MEGLDTDGGASLDPARHDGECLCVSVNLLVFAKAFAVDGEAFGEDEEGYRQLRWCYLLVRWRSVSIPQLEIEPNLL